MLVTLPLYILRELGKALLAPFVIYSFILLPFILASLLRENVGIWTVLKVSPLVFPYIAAYILPPTIITGTVLCYGRLSSDNEYGALQAGGIWPGWAVLPAVGVGIIATLSTLYMNESVLTYATRTINHTLVSGQIELIQRQLSRQGVVKVKNYHLYRFPPDEKQRQALDVTVYESEREARRDADEENEASRYPRVRQRIVARDHTIDVRSETDETGERTNTVVLKLVDVVTQYIDADGSGQMLESKRSTRSLQMEAELDAIISPDRVACWGIGELRQNVQRIEREREAGTLSEESYRKSRGKYTKELNTRMGLSFSCLLFAVVGTLLGLVLSHNDRSSRFVAGFAVAMGFFILFILARALSENPAWAWSLWLPNLALLGLVAWLWRSLTRGQ